MNRGLTFLMAVLAVGVGLWVWRQSGDREPLEAGAPDPTALQTAANELLLESAAAWNGGDLDGFMRWYRPDAGTSYIGSTGVVRGREAITGRYAPLFEPGAARDSLRFENLESRPLGPGLGLAIANYVLYRNDSTTAHGIFTLVLEHTDDGWRIVHDHTSALDR